MPTDEGAVGEVKMTRSRVPGPHDHEGYGDMDCDGDDYNVEDAVEDDEDDEDDEEDEDEGDDGDDDEVYQEDEALDSSPLESSPSDEGECHVDTDSDEQWSVSKGKRPLAGSVYERLARSSQEAVVPDQKRRLFRVRG